MNFQERLMQFINHTQLWQDLEEEQRANVEKLIKWARTLGHDGAEYIARILQRFFVIMSEDEPGKDKWSKRRAEVLKMYPQERVLRDFFFFAKPDNQFVAVHKRFAELAATNAVIANALKNLQYVGPDGKDRQSDDIYGELNSIGSKITTLEALPQGHLILQVGSGKWVALDTHNCKEEGDIMRHPLQKDTEVITKQGTYPIGQLALMPEVEVLTNTIGKAGTAHWQKCQFKSYGNQPLVRLTLHRGKTKHVIYTTREHRWFARRGTLSTFTIEEFTTEKLQPGYVIPQIFLHSVKESSPWKVKSVEETDRVEEVFCTIVQGTHCFALKHNIVTSNCGNAAGHTGDRMWSYREPSNVIKGMYEPRLTFIFDPKTKALGEMKAKANSKATKDLHPAIVALLKTGKVKRKDAP